MEDPVREIDFVIHALTQASPSGQEVTVNTYFTPDASFTHPFCRTGSFNNSRWVILKIYQWYKILSPRIDITVDSVAFDEKNLLLYVSMRQNFRLWIVPFYLADVGLTTVLQLSTPGHSDGKGGKKKYYIESQNDLYQTSEWIKFLVPWGVGVTLTMAWQFWATFLCLVGAYLLWPVSWLLENVIGGNAERMRNGSVLGVEKY